MVLPFLRAKSRQTSKSKISNKYLKPFPRNNTLKSVALAVALSVYKFDCSFAPAALPSYNRLAERYTSEHPPKRLTPLRESGRFPEEQSSAGKTTCNPSCTEGELKESSHITINAWSFRCLMTPTYELKCLKQI